MCLEFPGVQACGILGSCSANNTCVCDPGWSPSLEFVFFPFLRDSRLQPFLDDEEALLSQLPCSRNETFLQICFTICLIGNLLAIFFHLPALNTLNRIKRQIPLVSSFFFFAVTSLIRLSGDGIDRTFTNNIYAAISYALAVSSQSLSTNVFIFKYINYHLLKMNKHGRNSIYMWGYDMQYLFQHTVPYLKVADIICCPLLVFPAAIQDPEIAGSFQYLLMSYFVFRSFFVSLVSYLTICGVARDMESYVISADLLDVKNNGFYQYCKGAAGNLKTLVYSVICFCIPQGTLNVMYLAFYGLEGVWIYGFPILGFAWPVLSMLVGYLMKRNANLSKRAQTMKRTDGYVTKHGPKSTAVTSTEV